MIIQSCHIAQFGKWKEKNFDFSEGLNPFLWENGEGKTTLMHFFHILFYGLSGERKQDVSENERKHYMPFQGGSFGGNIHFQKNGKNYILERSFGLRKAEDSFRLLEENGKDSHDFTENIGEELFSLDSEAFQRVCMISHEDLSLHFNSTVHAKLGNVSDDDEDMKKFQKVQDTLKDAINALSPNRRTGAIFKKKMEEESLGIGLFQKKEEEERVLALETEVLRLEEESRKKEEEEEKLAEEVRKGILEKESLGKRVEYKKLSEELEKARFRYENAKKWYYQERYEDLSSLERDNLWKEEMQELREKIALLKKEVEQPALSVLPEVEEEKEKRNPLPFLLLFIAGFFLLLFVLKIAGLPLPLPGSLSLLIALLLSCIAFAVFYGEKEKKQRAAGKRSLEEEKRRKTESLRILSLEELLTRFHKLEDMLSLEKEEKERKEELAAFMEKEGEIKEISEEEYVSLEESQKQLDAVRKEQEFLRDRIREKREEREDRVESLKALSEQERRLFATREERIAMEERIHILQACKEYMEKAKEAFSSEYRGPILEGFVHYFHALCGVEQEFAITDELEIEFIERGIRRNLAYFSEGLQDLCRFALKLAVFDAMFPGEKPVLFLDDPFSHFDDEKGKKGIALLQELAKDRQVFYFTCSSVRAVS
ncbi:ATP-binding protein [Oribacterium parvum]